MPDSLVLNVRQITQYPPRTTVSPSDVTLLQVGGLGGAYWSAQLGTILATALNNGPAMGIGVPVPAGATNGLYASTINLLPSPVAISWGTGTFGCDPTGKFSWQAGPTALAALDSGGNLSVTGQVASCLGVLAPLANPQFQGIPTAPTANLNQTDSQIANTCFVQLLVAQYFQNTAQLGSPNFWGIPTAPTASSPIQADTQIANTCWVQLAIQNALNALNASTTWVNSFNGRTGIVCLNLYDVLQAGGAPIMSPAFGGQVTVPTPPPGDSSSLVPNTYWVTQSVVPMIEGAIGATYAPLDSPQFTGDPTGPTAPVGTSSGQLATTAYVMNAVASSVTGVASFNGRTGNVTLSLTDISNAGGAPRASPAFTGTPVAPTAVAGTSTQQLATTQFVMLALAAVATGVTSFNTRTGAVTLTSNDVIQAGGAPLASPALTGVPSAPTANPGTNTTQLATTQFVTAAITAAGGVSSFNGRSGAITLLANDISAAGGAELASPAFTGVPTTPTATAGTNSQQIASTAFVMAAVAAGTAGVSSFNTRTGAVTLQWADVSAVGGAPLAGPVFTGSPQAPTAAPGTNTTQLATTAFVAAAISGIAAGVTSFNTRTGAVTFTSADLSAVGGATLANPTFTGTPSAPTAVAGTNTTQIATTQFVTNAISSIGSGVVSWNTRTGAVTLQAADVTGVGGALLASPSFTGTPVAPTATAGTSTTQIATTAFVGTALTNLTKVTTFNTRSGAVTLTTADITGAGGAPAAAPTFTGVVTIPNAAAASNTTVAASTNWVRNYATGAFLPLAGGTLTGNLAVSVTAAPASIVINSSAAGNGEYLTGSVANTSRWLLYLGNTDAESGSNAGSNFTLAGYNDAGATVTASMQMTRATGAVNFSGSVTSGGSVYANTNVVALNSNLVSAVPSSGGAGFGFGTAAGPQMLFATTDSSGNYTAQIAHFDNTGQLTINGANAYKPSGGSWTATSDARIKHVEGNYRAGLNEILALQPVVYQYVGNDSVGPPEGVVPFDNSPHRNVAGQDFIGLIAQDVQAVLPECVSEADGYIDGIPVTDLRNLDTSPLIYALINAVKDLASQVAELRGPEPEEPKRKRRAA